MRWLWLAALSWCSALQAPPRRAHAILRAAADTTNADLPEPRVGDVVAFAGDWPGESSVGQIRSLQPRAGAWLADVVPLEDQAGDVWRLPTAQRARKRRTAVDVRELVPLESVEGGEEDSFVLTRLEPEVKDGPKPLAGTADGLAARAEAYAPLPPDFKPKGGSAKVDYAAEARSREEYAALKEQLLRDSALAAAAGLAAVAVATRNLDDVRAFALGAAGGLAYVAGLSAFADRAGDDRGGLDLSKYRLVFPVFSFLGLAALDAGAGKGAGALQVIPFDEFASAALGVVAYRVPLLARQVFGGGGAEDVAALLPGSLGKGARELVASREARGAQGAEDAAADAAAAAAAARAAQTVLVVCGPPGAGKTTLVDALLAADDRFARPAWRTTSGAGDVVDEAAFDAAADELAVSFEDDADADATLAEKAVPKKRGLPFSELANRADGRTAVLDCDVATARALEGVAGLRLVGVWASLSSLDALRERLTRVEAARAAAAMADASSDAIAAAVAATVSARLADVVDQIDFGVRSPMIEFTIITSDDVAASVSKLRKAAGYVFE